MCILLPAFTVGVISAVRLFRHFTLTFGIPSIGAVGILGHFILQAAWSSELQAAHLIGSGDVQVVVE